jgi:hypothetical protein
MMLLAFFSVLTAQSLSFGMSTTFFVRNWFHILSIKLIPSAYHLERLEVQIDSPSIDDTDMPCPEGHFPHLKTWLHFLTTFITPQQKLPEAGKWIDWPV